MGREEDSSGRLEERYLYAIFREGDFDTDLVSVSYSLRKAKEVVDKAFRESDMKPRFDRGDVLYVMRIRPNQIIPNRHIGFEKWNKLKRSALFKKKYNPDETYCADIFCG